MKLRRYFKTTEIALMRRLAAEKKSQKHVAAILDRDPGTVAQAALRYGIEFNAAPGRPLGDPEAQRLRRARNCRNWRRRKAGKPVPDVTRFDDPRLMVALALLGCLIVSLPASAERSYDPQILVLKFADGRRREVSATSPDTCTAAVKAIAEGKQVFLGPHPTSAHCQPGGRFAPCSQVIVGFNAPAACSGGSP